MASAGRTEIGEVRTPDVAEYLAVLREGDDDHPPLAASSAGRAVVAVRGLHSFAVAAGLAEADPARTVRPPAPPRRLPRAIPIPDVERLLQVPGDEPAQRRDRALLELLYGTGARISEAVGLDVDDLDLDAGDLRALVEHRHQLVELRTRAKNGLQAMALGYGLRRRGRLWSAAGQEELEKIPLREGMARRRKDLLQLVRQLTAWIKELDQRIEEEVARREDAQRLMTHPGVGPLTALGTVLVLGPVERFPDAKHVTSYVGLIPREDSSAGRQHFGRLTKQGNSLLRFLLVEAAQVASRYDDALGRVYRRLAFRKGAASAKVAVARKLAIRLYIMLRDGINYQEFCRRGSHAGMLVNKPMFWE